LPSLKKKKGKEEGKKKSATLSQTKRASFLRGRRRVLKAVNLDKGRWKIICFNPGARRAIRRDAL